MAARVVVYATPTCGHCAAAKRYLKEHRVAFREVDVSRDPGAAAEMKRKSRGTAVPVIDVNGRIIVGFDKRKLNAALGIKG
jgi:glutaredoxin 3